jgi:copper transport protein
MRTSRIAGVGAALAAALLFVQGAAAHARFVSANPVPGSVIAAPPARVTITFSEELARGTDITVTGPSGQVVSTGETARSGTQGSVALQAAGTGVYAVTWKSVSAEDGDEDSGSFEFGVGAPGTVFPRVGTGLISERTAGVWPAAAALVALVMLGAGAALVDGRARRPRAQTRG